MFWDFSPTYPTAHDIAHELDRMQQERLFQQKEFLREQQEYELAEESCKLFHEQSQPCPNCGTKMFDLHFGRYLRPYWWATLKPLDSPLPSMNLSELPIPNNRTIQIQGCERCCPRDVQERMNPRLYPSLLERQHNSCRV